jgi:hypothetical protein
LATGPEVPQEAQRLPQQGEEHIMSPAEFEATELPLHDYIVRTAEGDYKAQGVRVRSLVNGHGPDPRKISGQPDLILPDLRRVEMIETQTTARLLDPEKVAAHRDEGLEVWVVVPASYIAKAHEQLEGSADYIQPWSVETYEGRERVWFGEPQTP